MATEKMAITKVFNGYRDQINASLANGEKFTALLKQLLETNDADDLMTAAQALAGYKLDSDYLTFPIQYSMSDYLLLFMDRLLALHEMDDQFEVTQNQRSGSLEARLTAIPDLGSFEFHMEVGSEAGAFFTEIDSGQTLFYLNLPKKMIRFSSHALTQLFLIDNFDDEHVANVQAALKLLIQFGQFLKADFGMSVDFNILDTANAETYLVQSENLPAGVVDKLFILTGKAHYVLQNGVNNNGAQIDLKHDVVFNIFNNRLEGEPQWALTVHDPAQQVSWFDLLLSYDFLRQWYLENLGELEIKSDPLVFS